MIPGPMGIALLISKKDFKKPGPLSPLHEHDGAADWSAVRMTDHQKSQRPSRQHIAAVHFGPRGQKKEGTATWLKKKSATRKAIIDWRLDLSRKPLAIIVQQVSASVLHWKPPDGISVSTSNPICSDTRPLSCYCVPAEVHLRRSRC